MLEMATPATQTGARGATDRAAVTGIRTTVLLPAYNEATALPQVLEDLDEQLDSSYEVLVVDDGSTDDTAEVAGAHRCRVVRHAENRGKGIAIRTGVAQAQGDNVVIMDADATYPVAAIEEMVELLEDNDLVRGRRETGDENIPVLNRWGNRFFDWLLTVMHGLERGSDHLSGLYGLRKEAVERLGLEASGFDIEAEIGIKARKADLRIATMPISYHERVGEKKLSPWRDGLEILARVVVLLLIYNPVRAFIIPGLLFMATAMGGALLLSQGDVETSYLGLSIHSFIVAALGVLAAFQLSVFGLAAALYGVQAGHPPPPWLERLASRRVRLGVIGVGLTLVVVCGAKLLQLTIQWAGDDVFNDTRMLVLATSFLVLGLQILSAALFISIFSGRLEQHEAGLVDELPR